MSASTLDDLVEAYARVRSLNHEALDRFVEVAAQFRQQGIDFLVLKGADLLSRLYGAGGVRPMTDIDLLVHQSDLIPIDRLLTAYGFTREIDGNPAYRSPDGYLLLDITVDIWYLDHTALAGIWNRAVPRVIKRLPVRCMHTNDLVLYLTAYAVIHRAACTSQFAKDLTLVARLEQVDWESVAKEAIGRNLKVPVYYGFVLALLMQPNGAIPDDVLARLRPSTYSERWLLHFLRAAVTDKPVYGLGHLLLLLTQPTGARLRWLYQVFFPSTTFLAYRYGRVSTNNHPCRVRLTRILSLVVRTGGLIWRLMSMSWSSRERKA
jgi:hypothetical protein